jgi:flagellar motility protein MotE (MotC chaperone)
MTRILSSPLLVIVVASLVGVAAGLVPLWRAGDQLVAHLRVTKSKVVKDQKAQGWDFWTIEIDNLAAELKEEKARLSKQAELLDQRTARILAEQQELEKVRGSLEAMRREIGERVIEINADEAKNLRALSQTYSNLTPRAAVAIIRELDDLTAVKILTLMKADVVGPIFEEMSKTAAPDGTLARRAAVLSEKLRLMKAAKPAASTS